MPWKKRRFFPIGYGVEVIGHVNRDALMEQEHVTDPADPRRCQAKNSIGQCRGVKLEGSDYCRLHAGPYRPLGKGIRQYYLVKAEDRTRLAALAEHNDIKSLRDEIGLTRMMIEEIWNSGQSAAERLRNFGAVRLTSTTSKNWSRPVTRLKSAWVVCWQSRPCCASANGFASRWCRVCPGCRTTTSLSMFCRRMSSALSRKPGMMKRRRPWPRFHPRQSPNAIPRLVCLRSHCDIPG